MEENKEILEQQENVNPQPQPEEETPEVENVTPEEKPEEGGEKLETETEDKVEPVQKDTEEPEAEPKEPEQKLEEEDGSTSGDNDNKNDETEGESDAKEQVEKEEEPQEKTEEPEQPTPTQEEIMAQLEELRAEKEERAALEACNKEVMKVEREFNEITDDIAKKLRASFDANGIDPSKSLAELRKEDPAKATLAEQFINQAQSLKDQLQEAAIKEITKQQNSVIYKVASREFVKMNLNLEQAKNAVETFKRIVNEVGVSDLDEDLRMKVQLAAGRAKMMIQEVEAEVKEEPKDGKDTNVPSNTNVPLGTTETETPSPEIKTEKEDVQKPEKENNPPAKEPEPVVEKPKVEDFEEGVAGSNSTASGSMISEFNVLEELARLPYKEQRAFYKKHEDLITKALIKGQK